MCVSQVVLAAVCAHTETETRCCEKQWAAIQREKNQVKRANGGPACLSRFCLPRQEKHKLCANHQTGFKGFKVGWCKQCDKHYHGLDLNSKPVVLNYWEYKRTCNYFCVVNPDRVSRNVLRAPRTYEGNYQDVAMSSLQDALRHLRAQNVDISLLTIGDLKQWTARSLECAAASDCINNRQQLQTEDLRVSRHRFEDGYNPLNLKRQPRTCTIQYPAPLKLRKDEATLAPMCYAPSPQGKCPPSPIPNLDDFSARPTDELFLPDVKHQLDRPQAPTTTSDLMLRCYERTSTAAPIVHHVVDVPTAAPQPRRQAAARTGRVPRASRAFRELSWQSAASASAPALARARDSELQQMHFTLDGLMSAESPASRESPRLSAGRRAPPFVAKFNEGRAAPPTPGGTPVKGSPGRSIVAGVQPLCHCERERVRGRKECANCSFRKETQEAYGYGWI